jgi:hypothetical protein
MTPMIGALDEREHGVTTPPWTVVDCRHLWDWERPKGPTSLDGAPGRAQSPRDVVQEAHLREIKHRVGAHGRDSASRVTMRSPLGTMP